jgi:CobQ/CobB/MinD/ParA nucleotide binding domain
MNTKSKRLIIMAGGKGGVGKSSVASAIVDYANVSGIPLTAIDCDPENQKRGGLSTYHRGATKLSIRGERGLDDVITCLLDADTPSALVDLGAGSGVDAYRWFQDMAGPVIVDLGVKFTLVGVITSASAAVQTLFNWAHALQDKVEYLVVKNRRDGDDFPYFDATEEGKTFQRLTGAQIIGMEKRVGDIQAELENRLLTVGQALHPEDIDVGPLLSMVMVQMRLRGYFDRFNAELDRARALFLP